MIPRTVSRSVGQIGRAASRSVHTAVHTQPHGRWTKATTALAIGGAASLAIWSQYPSSLKLEGKMKTPEQPSTLPIGTFAKPNHDTTPENIALAKRELVELLGEKGVNDTPGELETRSSTEWSRSPTDRTASLIVFPNSTEEVSKIMKICHRRNIPVTPFSGGTSLDGALAATRGGICVDFRNMNRVLKLHKDDLDVVVQPAVGWEQLNESLNPQGLFFPVDPGPGAEIGGMIATGCSGTNAYRYGPMKDWVISVTVVLADGTVVKTRQRPRKSTAGYDLTRLIVGSSGTLGLVTEATLKITSTPKNTHVAVVSFPSLQAAVANVIDMIQSGIQTEAVEMLDTVAMHCANESGYLSREVTEKPSLFMKFAGASADAVKQQISVVEKLAKKNGSVAFEASGDSDTIEELWGARKTMLWNLIAQKNNPEDQIASCDVAVPISSLPQIIDETNAKFEAAGLLGSCMGHVGDGNFHAAVLYSPAEKEKADSIILWCRRRGIELEGTVTGEHGVGMELRDLVTEELGADATDMMRRIKLSLDPKCLLGCDKVVRIEKGKDH